MWRMKIQIILIGTALWSFVRSYPNEIVGIKIKIDKDHLAPYGIEPLCEAIRLGEETGLRISAHATDPIVPVDEFIDLFRPGDIYCHMFHETGEGILDESGNVRSSIRHARERGVLFDAAHGKTNNFSLSCAKKAIDQGFLPDIISSDYTKISLSARYPFTMMLSEILLVWYVFHRSPAMLHRKSSKAFVRALSPFPCTWRSSGPCH